MKAIIARDYLLPVFLFILVLSSNCFAVGDEFKQLLDVLKENKTLTEEQYNALLKAVDKSEAEEEPDEQADLHVSSKGGLEASTYDGEFSFELGGRLMIDGASYNEDEVTLGDGTEVRRARIEAKGTLFSDWGYELGIDFADSDADVKDAYLEYLGWWPASIKIGQFKEPFSLEEMTSSKYITFMERALPNDFAPGRHIGIGLHTYGESWTAASGLFGGALDDDVDDEGDEQWSLTGRVTYAPWRGDRQTLHLGTAFSYQTPDDERKVKFNARPESHITDVKYLNTGTIKEVDRISLFGLESALVQGPFSLQGEYIHTRVDRDMNLDSLDFDGWYIYGSWFLTGESRIYKAQKGSFGRVNPTTDMGAWELALRFSHMDLTDGEFTGGEADQITLGLNWYVNPQTRFMLNYVMVDNDINADDDGDVQGDDDPGVLQFRAQIDF